MIPLRFTYPKNTKFECSCCGICCGDTLSKTRHILLTNIDANRVAAFSKRKIEEFSSNTVGKGPYLFEMKKNPETGKCIFLIESKCTIYQHRPLICRFYPFELSSDETGTAVFTSTDECPGLGYEKCEAAKKLGVSYFRDLLRLAASELDQSSR